MFVYSATSAPRLIVGSWSSESSSTAHVAGERSSDCSTSGVPMLPPTNRRHARGLEHRRDERGRGCLALRAGHGQDAGAGEPQEQLDLAHELGAPRLGLRQRLAQPCIGRREAWRDRWAGHHEVRSDQEVARDARLDPEGERDRATLEGGNRIGELVGRSAVVDRHRRPLVGEEPGGRDAGASEAEHDGASTAEVSRGADGRRRGGHHRPVAPFTLTRKIENPRIPASAATIQKRTVIFSSAQPTSSKWWWSGAMRKMRRPRSR